MLLPWCAFTKLRKHTLRAFFNNRFAVASSLPRILLVIILPCDICTDDNFPDLD
jgi:hypothetical protein